VSLGLWFVPLLIAAACICDVLLHRPCEEGSRPDKSYSDSFSKDELLNASSKAQVKQ